MVFTTSVFWHKRLDLTRAIFTKGWRCCGKQPLKNEKIFADLVIDSSGIDSSFRKEVAKIFNITEGEVFFSKRDSNSLSISSAIASLEKDNKEISPVCSNQCDNIYFSFLKIVLFRVGDNTVIT